MNQTDSDEQSPAKKAWSKPAMKVWITPEIRDQSIWSLTEAKPNSNPSEASPQTGS